MQRLALPLLVLTLLFWAGSPLTAKADEPITESSSDEAFEEIMEWGQTAMARLERAAPLSLLAVRTGNYESSLRVLDNAVPGLRETITVEWTDERVKQAEQMLEKSLGTPVEDTARQLLNSAEELQLATLQSKVFPILFSVGVLSATGHHTAAIQLGEQTLKDLQNEDLLAKMADVEYQFRFFMIRSAIEGGRPGVFARHIGPALELAETEGQMPGDRLTLETYKVESKFSLDPELETYKRERAALWQRLVEANPETVDRRALTFWPSANRTLAAGYSPGSSERQFLDQRLEQDLKEVRLRAQKNWTASLTAETLDDWNPSPQVGLLDLYLELAGIARRAGDYEDATHFLSLVKESLPELKAKSEQINQLAKPRFLEYEIDFDAVKGHFTRVPARYHEESGRLQWALAGNDSQALNSSLDELERAMELYQLSGNPGPRQELLPLAMLLKVRSGKLAAEEGLKELNSHRASPGLEANRSVLIQEQLTAGELRALSEDWKGAARELEQGLKGYETLLAEVGPRSLLAEKLRESAMLAYDTLFQALKETNSTEQALAVLDRKSQAQAIDSLDVAASQAHNPEIKNKLEVLQKTQQRLLGLQQEMERARSTEGTRPNKAEEELGRAHQEFQEAVQALEGSSFERYLSIKPLLLSSVQQSIPLDTAIVQTAFRESGTVLFVVTREGVKVHELDLKLEQFEQLVTQFRQELFLNNPPGIKWDSPQQKKFLEASSLLHSSLIEPIEASLVSKKVIAFVPAGPLYYLPFQSLAKLDEKGQPNFLIERFQVVTLCKPSDLEYLSAQARKPSKGLTAFGNPDGTLPGAEEEVTKLAELYPNALIYLGAQALKSRLFNSGTDSGMLHLATHGIINPRNPRFSYLVLAGEGRDSRLTFSDITGLGLSQNRLVTLSACDTALGSRQPGSENIEDTENRDDKYLVSSLAEAFTAAGSPTVLASLWKVDDEATRILMTRFYTEMKNGLAPGAAMQQAQIALLRDGRFGHPFYWSPFVMWGDWR